MSKEFLHSHKQKYSTSPYWDWVGANGGLEPISNFAQMAELTIPQDDQLDAILDALNSGVLDELTPAQAHAWQLCGVEGLTQEQAAQGLGVDQANVSRAYALAVEIIAARAQQQYDLTHADRISQNRKKLKELADLAAKFKASGRFSSPTK